MFCLVNLVNIAQKWLVPPPSTDVIYFAQWLTLDQMWCWKKPSWQDGGFHRKAVLDFMCHIVKPRWEDIFIEWSQAKDNPGLNILSFSWLLLKLPSNQNLICRFFLLICLSLITSHGWCKATPPQQKAALTLGGFVFLRQGWWNKRGQVVIKGGIKCRCITWASSVIGLVGLTLVSLVPLKRRTQTTLSFLHSLFGCLNQHVFSENQTLQHEDSSSNFSACPRSLPSLKLTVRPWKWAWPKGNIIFQPS